MAVPSGAASGMVVDVDGDGRPDTAWIGTEPDGVTRVGIVTAAGGGAERVFESASPVIRSVLVVDVDDQPPVELLADDGRSVQLWAFDDCAIEDVLNVDEDPYTFSLGFTDVGTGVGCVEIDGRRRLVGLDVRSDDADTVEWARTVIDLDGLEARNGQIAMGTYHRPADDPEIELLHQVTCGDMTMTDDGITAPQP